MTYYKKPIFFILKEEFNKKYLIYKKKYLKLKEMLGSGGPSLSPSERQVTIETTARQPKQMREPTEVELKEEAIVAAAFLAAHNRRNQVEPVKKLDSTHRLVYKPLFSTSAIFPKNDIFEKNTIFTKIFEVEIPNNAFESIKDNLPAMYQKICTEMGFTIKGTRQVDYIYVNDYNHYILFRINEQYISLFFDVDYMHNLDYDSFNYIFNQFHKIAYILSILYKNKPTLEDVNEKRTIIWYPKYIEELISTDDITYTLMKYITFLPMYYLNIVTFSNFPDRNLYLDYVYNIFSVKSTISELNKIINGEDITLPEYPQLPLPETIEKSSDYELFNNMIYKLTGREFPSKFEFNLIMTTLEELLHKTKDKRQEIYNLYLAQKKILLIIELAFIANHYKAYSIVFEIICSLYLNQIDDVKKRWSGYRQLIKYTKEEWDEEEEMYKIEMLKGGKKYKLSNLAKLK